MRSLSTSLQTDPLPAAIVELTSIQLSGHPSSIAPNMIVRRRMSGSFAPLITHTSRFLSQ